MEKRDKMKRLYTLVNTDLTEENDVLPRKPTCMQPKYTTKVRSIEEEKHQKETFSEVLKKYKALKQSFKEAE